MGPTHDGRIAPILEERLNQMGVCVCACACAMVSGSVLQDLGSR